MPPVIGPVTVVVRHGGEVASGASAISCDPGEEAPSFISPPRARKFVIRAARTRVESIPFRRGCRRFPDSLLVGRTISPVTSSAARKNGNFRACGAGAIPSVSYWLLRPHGAAPAVSRLGTRRWRPAGASSGGSGPLVSFGLVPFVDLAIGRTPSNPPDVRGGPARGRSPTTAGACISSCRSSSPRSCSRAGCGRTATSPPSRARTRLHRRDGRGHLDQHRARARPQAQRARAVARRSLRSRRPATGTSSSSTTAATTCAWRRPRIPRARGSARASGRSCRARCGGACARRSRSSARGSRAAGQPDSGRRDNELLNAWAFSAALFGALVAVFGIGVAPWLARAGGDRLLAARGGELHRALRPAAPADRRRARSSAAAPSTAGTRTTSPRTCSSTTCSATPTTTRTRRAASRRAAPLRRGCPSCRSGYAGMILLAYVPPLWRRVMDPRVVAHYGGDARAREHPSPPHARGSSRSTEHRRAGAEGGIPPSWAEWPDALASLA